MLRNGSSRVGASSSNDDDTTSTSTTEYESFNVEEALLPGDRSAADGGRAWWIGGDLLAACTVVYLRGHCIAPTPRTCSFASSSTPSSHPPSPSSFSSSSVSALF
jgi:hypothetical protein